MDETAFSAAADAELQALESMMENAGLEVELADGVLTIEADSGPMVVNKHQPTGQLWLASPALGASRFAYKDGGWFHTDTGERLEALLTRELGL